MRTDKAAPVTLRSWSPCAFTSREKTIVPFQGDRSVYCKYNEIFPADKLFRCNSLRAHCNLSYGGAGKTETLAGFLN